MSFKGRKALVPMKTGAELDFLTKNHARFYRFSTGYRKWLKRGFNRRVRVAGKAEARDE